VQLDPIYVTAKVALVLYNDFVLLRSELKTKGIDIPELELFVQLAGNRSYPHSGIFENWAHSSDDTSGTIAGRALFPNPDGLLLPGQNVTLGGRAARAVTRIMIPQRAVMQDQQGRYVYTVDADDVVRRQNIEVGIRDGADWAVTSGLDEGSRVIVQGLQSLRPGTELVINNG
jgi:RND family efflux transporter MFP subunit